MFEWDLFSMMKEQENEVSHKGEILTATNEKLKQPELSFIVENTDVDESLNATEDLIVSNDEPLSYEVGNVVQINFPTEKSDFELYNFLHHYYSHLRGKKGKIMKIMPYKKVQYLIEFDVKHEDKQLILDHHDVIWLSDY